MPWYQKKKSKSRYDNYYSRGSAPKAVEGATRKSYGVTWWGAQWLKALDKIDYSNRLPRGKTYANKGLVSGVEFQGNTIRANVQGLYAEAV